MTQCPSLSGMLRRGQEITHCHHSQGWIETPDGKFFQPKASKIRFISGMAKPFMAGAKRRRRWFAWLMGISA